MAGSAYTYGGPCAAGDRLAGPHAVCTAGGGGQFVYDGNGNVTNSGSRSVIYNPANKVTHVESDPAVSQGNDAGSVDFMYGADANRVVQAVTSGGVTSRTVYVGLGGTGKSLYERTTTAGAPTKHVHFIYAGATHGGGAFALRVLDDAGAVTANRYYSFDHLGSVTAMSDEQGRVSATGSDPTVFSYDAWGGRRNPDGTAANPASFNLPVGHREFTGQEQIPNVALVNMNGRVYDPSLGRFLSPDPNVQFAADLQSYNRYSYTGNNPLRYTDPTGYFWSEIGGFFSGTFGDPIKDWEFLVVAGVCIGGGPAACMVAGMTLAAVNATVAIAQGAPVDQTIALTVIGLGIGLATGGVGQELGLNAWQGLIFGSASAAFSTGISNALSGRSFFEWNVLDAALASAAQGAVMLGLQKVATVSQASADPEAAHEGSTHSANVRRGSGRETFEKGEIDPDEPIADKNVRKEMLKSWNRSGRGDSMHEEGATMDRGEGERFGNLRRWKPSTTLEEARFFHEAPGSDAVPLDPAKENVEWHSHPWKVGTRLWKEDGVWVKTGAGPSFNDVGSYVGNVHQGVNLTSYVLTPEGIYRLGSKIEWIAPIDYLRK